MHHVETPSGSAPAANDRIIVGSKQGIANVVGGGAGQAVTTAVAMKGLPASYSVTVDPKQDATWYTANHTADGFDVVLTPRLAANTLAAGSFDVTVVA